MHFSRTVVAFWIVSVPIVAHTQSGHTVHTHDARPKARSSTKPINIVYLMHASRAAVERHTGYPIAKSVDQVNEGGLFCHYRVHGNEYVVDYVDGRVTNIVLTLRASFTSPEAALRATGISLAGHKPAIASKINRVWRGSLSPTGVRFLAIGRTSEGWNEIEVRDNGEM